MTAPIRGFRNKTHQDLCGLQEAYRAQILAFSRKFLPVRFPPAVRRRMVEAVIAQGRPIDFDIRMTAGPPTVPTLPTLPTSILAWPCDCDAIEERAFRECYTKT